MSSARLPPKLWKSLHYEGWPPVLPSPQANCSFSRPQAIYFAFNSFACGLHNINIHTHLEPFLCPSLSGIVGT